MPCYMLYGVLLRNHGQQRRQTFVLFLCEAIAFDAFEFNADGKVIALRTTCVCRYTCVPCTVIATDKLQQLAATANIKVR